jgi:predicted membrane protein
LKISSIFIIAASIVNIFLNLFILWVALGWKVRKTRKAFEKQLISQGMAKKDAKRLSAQYAKLKNEIMNTFKGSLFRNRWFSGVSIDL